MSRAMIVLNTDSDRLRAARWAHGIPLGSRIEFKAPKRSLPQNDKFWACLTDVSQQVLWHGIRMSPDDWKLVFMDALKREVRMVPNFDGDGFVNLSTSSSDLSKDEMSDLIELMFKFGANPDHPVQFRESSDAGIPVSSEGGAECEPGAPGGALPGQAAGADTGYRKTAAELADRRRKHRPTRDILEQRRELIHQNLRGA